MAKYLVDCGSCDLDGNLTKHKAYEFSSLEAAEATAELMFLAGVWNSVDVWVDDELWSTFEC